MEDFQGRHYFLPQLTSVWVQVGFFGRFEKAARWSLLDGEAILIPEDGRGSPKGWLLVSQSEEPVLPAAVAVKCALALCTVHHLQSSTSMVSAVQVCPQRPSLVAAAPPRPPVQLQSGFRIGRRCSTKTKTRWPVSSVARGLEPVRRHHARPRQHPPPIFHHRPSPRRASRGKQGGHGGLWRPCLEKVGLVIDYMVGQRLHLESRSKAAHNSVIKGILPIWQDRHRHNQQANAVVSIASLFSK